MVGLSFESECSVPPYYRTGVFGIGADTNDTGRTGRIVLIPEFLYGRSLHRMSGGLTTQGKGMETSPVVFIVRSILKIAGVTQLVECNLAKVDVAGSNPVSRSCDQMRAAHQE